VNDLLVGTLGGCTAFAAYTYFGYPAILRLLGHRKGAERRDPPSEWPSISIVVPAYNEAQAIGQTLNRILAADYPADRRQVLVVSDASTDGTDDIVRSFADRGVELVRMNTRGGKTRNENAVLPLLRGEIVVNTDAAMRVDPAAFKELVLALEAPEVGVASGRDVSVAPGEGERQGTEGAYVGYEMWVRDLETRISGIVGASGCLYAMRAMLHCQPVPDHLSRDFAAAMTARLAGYRAVSVPGAVCFVPYTPSLRREYHRKVRTIDRGLVTLAHRASLLNPFRDGIFAWMLWSHKVFRWLVPWAMLLGLAALAALTPEVEWARWLMGVVAVVGMLGVAGWIWPEGKPAPRAFAIPAYLIAGNLAVIHAWIRAATGRGTPVWEPTRRTATT
jgi:cellulose synthase/poly-beta-1,6-N-acetylglucosamine synthase-like glycosyltransferase